MITGFFSFHKNDNNDNFFPTKFNNFFYILSVSLSPLSLSLSVFLPRPPPLSLSQSQFSLSHLFSYLCLSGLFVWFSLTISLSVCLCICLSQYIHISKVGDRSRGWPCREEENLIFVLARYLIRHRISPNQDDISHSARTFISGYQTGERPNTLSSAGGGD